MRITPWDQALARRTAVSWLLLLALATTVLVATDEADANTRTRLARLCALSPALAALAVGLIVRRLDQTGELRALACLGIPRARVLAGAVLVAASVGGLAALLLALGVGSLDALFPPLSGEPWRFADGVFHGPGVSFEGIDGVARFEPIVARATTSFGARGIVALAIGLFGVSLPLWSAFPERPLARFVVGGGLVVAAIFAFHAVAAGSSASWLLAPPLALLAYVGLRCGLHGARAHG